MMRIFAVLLSWTALLTTAVAQSGSTSPKSDATKMPNQVFELRTYTLIDENAEQKLDSYLENALVPALERQGLGPIGVFDQASKPQDGTIEVMLLIPGPSTEAVTSAAGKLTNDKEYQAAARDYMNTPANEPVVQRIRSELLLAFDCWPQVTVPSQKEGNQPRLFELRTYESPTEQFGALKVEMFNAGEVPIFLDSKITPVFMGQALIGDMMPNLTYMTVFDNDQARQAGWDAFRSSPDWKVLSGIEKYKGTVNKIHKSDWVPKSFSRL